MPWAKAVFLAGLAVTAVVPSLRGLVADKTEPAAVQPLSRTAFEGKILKPLPLTAKEADFYSRFPGGIGKFSDGRRIIIIRTVTAPTRRLHPAADCFRAMGSNITHLPLYQDTEGIQWGRFRAESAEAVLEVRECIRDSRGQVYSDISAWYWQALTGASTGPWVAVMVVEHSE